MFVFCFSPFCLKPCGFSRPGDFFDTIRTRGTGGGRQAWQMKKYGIPDLAQIAVIGVPLCAAKNAAVFFHAAKPQAVACRRHRRA